ncbi:MAG: hypothetical protein ABR524_05055 [Thermoanaerobaculia bacterium]
MGSAGDVATKRDDQSGGLTSEERGLYRMIGIFAVVFPLTFFPLRHFLWDPLASGITGVVVVLATWLVGDRSGWRASVWNAVTLAVLAGVSAFAIALAFDWLWPVA